MRSRYHAEVDPEAENTSHALALGLIGHNRRVLELGSASGHVTRVLVERHCDVTAVEYEAEVARELEGLASRVVVGDLNDPSVLDGLEPSFDVVLAGDVLEHLVDPEAVLRRAARLLVPGGRVVISLPNVAHADLRMSLLQGRWDYRSWGLLDRTHLRFFTRQGIEALVDQAGLVMTELRRVRMPAFESELAVARDSVPTAVVDHVLADPEAETYQFVLAAIREGHDDQVRRVAADKAVAELQLDRAQLARRALEAELGLLRRELTELRREAEDRERHLVSVIRAEAAERDRQVAERDEQLAELAARHHATSAEQEHARAELEAAARELRRVEESVTWQALQRARAAVVRGAPGQEPRPVRALQAGLRGFGRVALRPRR